MEIGDAGNADDTTGSPNPAGKVEYDYRIGKYEISEDMINKANTLGGLGITKDTRGADKPATNITWYEAAMFAFSAGALEECGRMVGGWRKAL